MNIAKQTSYEPELSKTQAMSEQVAFSYIRFSTKGQTSGDSLSRQLLKARDYARRHNLKLDESSFQDLGISAFKGKNATDGALKAFLDAVDDGTIPKGATLLIENFDRLSRAQVQDALELFLSITKRGVTLVTLTDEQVYNRQSINDNWTKLIISLATMARAHEESATKAVRTRSGKLAAIAAGFKHGKCPFWLEATIDRRSYKVIEDRAAIIRSAFAMRLQGIGSLRIARFLNETCGFKWGSSQAARLLQNPAVIGIRISQAGYEPLLDYYPSIIEKSNFYEVQQIMTAVVGTKRGRKAQDEPNLFTGLTRCARCGSAMRFFRASRNVSQQYIRCLAAVTRAGCDSEGYVNYDAFEKEVIGWLLLDQDEELISLLEKKPTRVKASNYEVKNLRDQQARLLDLAASGVMNTRLVTERLNALELQIKDLESLIPETHLNDRLFAEKAWELVERHEDAKLGDDKERLYEVRRELKGAFARSIELIRVFPEPRVDDTHHAKFSVRFRGFEGELIREYTRPALNNVKGVMNGWKANCQR